jgi:hypothetical protein
MGWAGRLCSREHPSSTGSVADNGMHVLRRDDPPLRLADDDDYHGLHSAAGVAGLFSHDYESGCGTASRCFSNSVEGVRRGCPVDNTSRVKSSIPPISPLVALRWLVGGGSGYLLDLGFPWHWNGFGFIILKPPPLLVVYWAYYLHNYALLVWCQ